MTSTVPVYPEGGVRAVMLVGEFTMTCVADFPSINTEESSETTVDELNNRTARLTTPEQG